MGTSVSAILTATTSAGGGTPPSAPTALTISAVGSTQLTLSWTAPAAGLPVTYQPQYRVSGSQTWNKYPASGAILGTSTVITGLTANTAYDFEVIATNGYGSATSPTVSQITTGIAPSAPTNFAVVPGNTTTLHATWTASSAGAPAPTYSLSYRTPPGAGNFQAFATTTQGASLDITGLTPGTTYEVKLTATNSAGSASPATNVNVATLSSLVLPGQPTALTASAITGRSVTLAWTKPATGSGPFTNTIEYSLAGQNAWATAGTTVDPTDSFIVNNLTAGTYYDFRVTASNAAGHGTPSTVLTVQTTSSGNVRNVTLNPSADGSMWVTPFGSNASWSGSSDPDTLSLLGKVGTVNAANFGIPIYVAAPTDPLVTFTSTGGPGTQRDPNLTATLRCPANALPASPFPGGDCQMILFDPTTDATKMWAFGPCSFNNGKDVTGGVTAAYGEVDIVCGSMEDAITGNWGYNAGIGVIRAADLTNPNGIQHGLRFACDLSQLLPPTAWDVPTNPSTRTVNGRTVAAGAVQIYWPQTHTDYNAPTSWTGNMPAGATVGIPANVAMPAGLSAGGQMLWKNAQTFGWHWRDTAGSGITLYAEPSLENNSLIAGMRGDMAKIAPYLRILRNQGPNSIQGGGTPVAAAPPPIDPAVCGAPTAPAQVAGVALVSDTATSATLLWTQPSGSLPMTYTIQASTHAANAWTLSSATISGTSGTISGLPSGGNMDFRVVAANAAGSGTPSSTLNVQLPATTTTNVTFDPASSSATFTYSTDKTIATSGTPATGQSQTAITSAAQASGKVMVEFTVQALTQSIAFGLCNAARPTGSSGFGADTNAIAYYPVSPTMTVYFANAAMVGAFGGQTPLVNGAIVTICADLDAKLFWATDPAMRAAFGANAWNCSANANPATGAGGLSFTAMAGPYYAAFNDDDANGVAQINTGQRAFSIAAPSGFLPWSGAGSSAGGGSVSPPPPLPGQPTGLTATAETANSVTLSWVAPTVTGNPSLTYLLESSPHGQGLWTGRGTTANTQATAINLSPATNYDFRVTASDTAGSGQPSAIATASTTAQTQTSGLPRSTTGIFNYLVSIAGKGSISGQFVERGPIDPINAIQSSTGKWLGMIEGDYWWFGSGSQSADLSFNPVAIAYWNAGGLIALIGSMPNPTTGGGSNDTSSLDAANLLTNGSATNTRFMATIDSVAAGIAALQTAGVTVIFRPFHEANGNWFWWGTGRMSDAQFVAMWQFVYNYFTNTKGLKNILWLYSVNSGISSNFPMNNRYPGASYVDLMGVDAYTSNPAGLVGDYNFLLTYSKPVCFSEFGSGSPSAGDTAFNQQTLINALKNSMPKVVFWTQWWDGNSGGAGWGLAEVQNAAGALADPWTINRDALVAAFAASSGTGINPLVTSPLTGGASPVISQSVRDDSGNTWTVVNGQVAVNGVVDTTTANVVGLVSYSGKVWHKNTAGYWYGKSSPSGPWGNGIIAPPAAGMTAAVYYVKDGQVYDPSGNAWFGRGLNIEDSGYSSVISNSSTGAPLLTTLFPGTNILRIPAGSYGAPSSYDAIVQPATALGIVCILENHQNFNANGSSAGGGGGAQGVILTGTMLQTENNWYQSIAAYYKNNPLVWFGTNNEPSETDPSTGAFSPAGLSAWQKSTYDAIRGAGNLSPIMVEVNGGIGPSSYGQGYTQSLYANMTNIMLDIHTYNWVFQDSGGHYLTDLATIKSQFKANIQGAQAHLPTADGTAPVLIGEYGISTNGVDVDPGGVQTCQAVQSFTGFGNLVAANTAWNFFRLGTGLSDDLTDSNGHLTAYGTQVAGWIKSASQTVPPPKATVSAGTWQLGQINGMYYWWLAPANYDPSKSYPLVLYLHQLAQADPFYSNGASGNGDAVKPQIDPWFNNVSFRTNHPCFVIAPLLDMRADESGNTINWGGIDGNQQQGQTNYMALVSYFKTTYPIHPGHVYCTGNSMGGIGSWDCAVRYNAQSGTNGKVFAAFLILAGATYAYNYPNPTATMLANLKNVPIWAIHGAQDTQVPLGWDQAMYAGYGGSTAYNGAQAPNGLMRYTQDPSLGHDVWDTYYVEPTAETYWAWLFAQSDNIGPSGTGSGSGTTPTPTPTPPPTTQTRNYWDHPGTNVSVWNTPLGSGAVWGTATDADTIDLRHGGFINSTDNFGAVCWVSRSADNPTATFTSKMGDYEVAGANHGSGTPISVTAHLVPGSYAPGPFPGDNQYCFVDTVGNPGYYYHFAPIEMTSFAAGQGPFNQPGGGGREDAMSDNFGEDWETGHANDVQTVGIIRAYDLDPARNAARLPGSTTVTAIQHMLRYGHDAKYLKANAVSTANGNPDYPNGTLNPNSWPQLYQDWQAGINLYTGNLVYGTTIGIPATVSMPAGLTQAGQQLFWTLQNYGAITREQAGGGLHFWADQDVPQSWVNQANSDMPTLTALLCPLRNQHQGGQSFTSNPRNGPGTRLDVGPPPLAPLSATASTGTTPVYPSPSGTTVQSVGPSLVDASGEIWTLTGTAAGSYFAVINGVTDNSVSNISQLLYYNNLVYYQAANGVWYSKTKATDAWSSGGADPRGATASPSPSGTTVQYVGPSLVDASGETWTLTGTAAGSYSAVINGVTDNSVSNIAQLLYYNNLVYYQTGSGLWFSKAKASNAWTAAPADPRS